MCVNNLSKVALDSAAAGTEPAISSHKYNALTTAPPSHTLPHETTMVLKTAQNTCKRQRKTIAPVEYRCN